MKHPEAHRIGYIIGYVGFLVATAGVPALAIWGFAHRWPR